MFFLVLALMAVLATAGLLGLTADSRQYSLPTGGDAPKLQPRL
jgi:hypothetical protein